MQFPSRENYPDFYEKYISRVHGEVLELLDRQIQEVANQFNEYKFKENYRYAENKWTVKEVLGHLIDFERVLVFRMTCIARMDSQPLPNFDQELYAVNSNYKNRTLQSVIEEFTTLRRANMFFFQTLTEDDLNRSGIVSNYMVQVRALLYVCAGHIVHHSDVLELNY